MNNDGIYGTDNIVAENVPRAYEPPPEIQARYRNFKILTITALVLLFVVLTHGTVLVTVRFFMNQILAIKELIVFFTGLFILIIGLVLWRAYDYITHSLSYPNIITLIVAEVVMLAGQVIMCNFCVPALLGYMLIFSVVFILYVLIFLKCKFPYRVIISMITVSVLVTTNYIHLHSISFTPRYIYISTAGYQDKISDETTYYYEQPVNQPVYSEDPINKLLEEINYVSEWPLYIDRVEEGESGEDGNYLKYLDIISNKIFKLSEVVNFNGNYDESFFKKKGISLSVLELENPNDTIECTGFQYSLSFGRPIIEYKRSNAPATDERAICIIVYEISNVYKEDIFFHAPKFNPRKSTIHYC